nr:unnamed protein product [Spirometra erinaceieuropaei]
MLDSACTGNLLAEKNKLHKAQTDGRTATGKAAFFMWRRLMRQRPREMQNDWMAQKAEEMQGYVDLNKTKKLFTSIRTAYGPIAITSSLSPDGTTILTAKSWTLKRRTELFKRILNRPCAICDAAIDRLPQVKVKIDLGLAPSLSETIPAVQQLSGEKAPESEVILTDVLTQGQTGRMLGSHIHEHELAVRRGGALSQVATHTYEMGHELNFAVTKIVAHAGNKTGRELVEAWASDETSADRFIYLAPAYRALRSHFQSRVIGR